MKLIDGTLNSGSDLHIYRGHTVSLLLLAAMTTEFPDMIDSASQPGIKQTGFTLVSPPHHLSNPLTS
jgi:hypothetical protein